MDKGAAKENARINQRDLMGKLDRIIQLLEILVMREG